MHLTLADADSVIKQSVGGHSQRQIEVEEHAGVNLRGADVCCQEAAHFLVIRQL